MDTNTWLAIIAIVLSCGLGVGLIYLYKKKIIKAETLTQAATLLDGVDIVGSGFIAQIAEYARIAVHAVEQLAKTGVIEKDNDTKKQTAMEYVQQFAKVDEVTLSPADLETADLLVEAAVAELPRNK
jgi:hypothetical protein